jgi:glycosyltransferase involved in cell wall biosynthesis
MFYKEENFCVDSRVQGYSNMYSLMENYVKKEKELENCSINFSVPSFGAETNSIKITMWESTRLKYSDVLLLNKYKVIFVPSESLKNVFYESGVTRPIEIFEPFINDIFCYQPHRNKKKLIFGLGFNKSVTRKNEFNTIKYFLEAFEDKNDVELWIKTDKEINIENNKIRFFYAPFSDKEMLEWYSDIDVFVNLAKGEGIGMFNLESMAVGRPLVANCFLSVQDYLNKENGYCIDYDLNYTDDKFFSNCGKWAFSKKESVIKTFKNIYNNREQIKEKGFTSSKTVEKYKASKAVPELIKKLKLYV